jgi:hydroxymethylpyrimidine pyrophosphatase-like HAD family hydrolase
MKFSVLALDYDGIIARDGHADPAVLEAIREARSRQIVIALVTGRILSDLQRVLAEQGLFDVIVAENGAVLAFPSGRTRLLGRPPPQAFLDELCRLKVAFKIGECVLEADASAAPKILDAVRNLELPLMLVFNGGRVMVLPQAINKATGLREALNTLRLSLHNCIAIGDAENDFALLEACEIGVAVSWGSKSLCAIADDVLLGSGPAAVADYIRRVSAHTKLPPNRTDRRRIILGKTADGRSVETAVHGHNILIAGDPRSGKSWITGLFCEQLILQGYCLCVIDPEGDYATLESLPGVVVFGSEEPPPRLSDVARALRYPEVSIVIDLSAITHAEKLSYLDKLLPMLAALRRRIGLPHWIVVDEAHYFLHQPDLGQRVDFELAAYVLITYRPSQLHPELLGAVESIIVTPLTDPWEVRALTTLCGAQVMEAEWGNVLGGLGIDEAAVLPQEAGARRVPQPFTITERITLHVRHRAKYFEVPMPEEQAFIFTCNGQLIGEQARTLREFVTIQDRLPVAAIEGHAQRGDYSRWIAEVFGDHLLAAEIRKIEKQFRRDRVANFSESLIQLIYGRYELTG